jgi:hypothetical protein
MGVITRETANQIALAWREIEAGEALLAEVRGALDKREITDIRDVFGRRHRELELGVPSGPSAHRLFNVPFTLAIPVIEAHIAHHRAMVATLSEKAKSEACGNG